MLTFSAVRSYNNNNILSTVSFWGPLAVFLMYFVLVISGDRINGCYLLWDTLVGYMKFLFVLEQLGVVAVALE